jgi:hypothetical protein
MKIRPNRVNGWSSLRRLGQILIFSCGWAIHAPELAYAQLATPSLCLTTSSSCDCTSKLDERIINPGPTTFQLSLIPGTTGSSNLNNVCVFGATDANGDEVCALAIGLESTSPEIVLNSFTANALLSPAVVSNRVSDSNIILNHFNPAGDSACIELGTLQVDRDDPSSITGDAFIQLTATTSEWVDAALEVHTFPTTYLPEPSKPVGLGIGTLFMICAFGLRSRKRYPRRFLPRRVAIATGVALIMAGEAQAFEYFELDSFLARLGPGARHIDFESFPLDDNGYGVFSAGQEIRRGAALSADFVPSPISLDGPPQSYFGTFLVFESPATFGRVASPGSTNAGQDDVRVRFEAPVRAAGIRVIDATTNDGSSLTSTDQVLFLNAYGGILAQYSLGSARKGQSAFVGYVARPGSLPVAELRVVESVGGLIPEDNIWIDDVVYLADADPYADEWVRFVPNNGGTATELPEWDATRALDEEDSLYTSLGPAGEIVVQFTDNSLIGDGQINPDLRIWGLSGSTGITTVEISEDGTVWLQVGAATGHVTNLDIDPVSSPGIHYSFVRLTQLSQSATSEIDAIEALSSIAIADQDFDGIADGVDNCLSQPNPTQADDDEDGIGNRCDNCRPIANPTQTDLNGDGKGDVCEMPKLRLIQDAPSLSTGLQSTGADLYLDCGGSDLQELNVGLTIPPSATQVQFGRLFGELGEGCESPQQTNILSPVSGMGCSGRTGIGSTVDPTLSGISIPGSSVPSPYRQDALFLFLSAGPLQSDLLCVAHQTNVYLGRINFSAPGSGGYNSRMAFTQRGALLGALSPTGPGSPPSQRQPMSYRTESAPPPMLRSFGTGASPPSGLTLEIIPSAGQVAETAVSWDICITDESTLLMHRISFALQGPTGATDSNAIGLVGCTGTPDTTGRRACNQGDLYSDVDATASWAFGPYNAADSSTFGTFGMYVEPETLYVLLQGKGPNDSGTAGLLNTTTVASTCVATITVGDAGVAPVVIFAGIDTVTAPDEPFVDEGGNSVDGTTGVSWTTSGDTGYDADGDGYLDGNDNCEIVSNDQTNSGGFRAEGAAVDIDGDACECGDGNDTGIVWENGVETLVSTSDVQSIREYLAQISNDTSTRIKCSAIGTTTCNMADAFAWYQYLDNDNADGDGLCEATSGAPPE